MASIQLTDTEWLQLLDGESDDSELSRCCANVSALRDVLVRIVRGGRNETVHSWLLRDLKQKLTWVADGHDLTPLLLKVCDQLDFQPAEAEHEPGPH